VGKSTSIFNKNEKQKPYNKSRSPTIHQRVLAHLLLLPLQLLNWPQLRGFITARGHQIDGLLLLGHDARVGARAELVLLAFASSHRALNSGGREHRRAQSCGALLLVSAGLRL
jgi:hypothetical protein